MITNLAQNIEKTEQPLSRKEIESAVAKLYLFSNREEWTVGKTIRNRVEIHIEV